MQMLRVSEQLKQSLYAKVLVDWAIYPSDEPKIILQQEHRAFFVKQKKGILMLANRFLQMIAPGKDWIESW